MGKMNRLAERLNERMEFASWTQEAIAEALGTTQQTVSRWMLGRCEPKLDTLLKLCLILGTDPNDLLGYDELR